MGTKFVDGTEMIFCTDPWCLETESEFGRQSADGYKGGTKMFHSENQHQKHVKLLNKGD